MTDTVQDTAKVERKDVIGNSLLFSLFLGETAYLYFASSAILILCGVLGMITYGYALKYNPRFLRYMIPLAVGIVALITINRIWVLNCGWSGCLRITLISLPIAYLLCDVRINKVAALSFFYAVFAYTVVMIALADPAELYRIFAASSRNYISVLLIACLFPYYAACSRDSAKVSAFPALLSLLVSVYVQSRGGIVASGLLVVLTLIRELYLGIAKHAFKNRRKQIRLLVFASLLCGAILILVLKPVIVKTAEKADTEDNPAGYFSRFSEPEEYPITRMDMWKEYLTVTASSFKNIVMGPPLTTCSLIRAEEGNSHNSYFMTHSYTGIVGFLIVIAGGIGYSVLCIKRKQYNLLFLSLAFLLRATTDYLFPILFCDCLILFMIMQTGIGITGEAYEHQKR